MKHLTILFLLGLTACQRDEVTSTVDQGLQAINAETETCSACGMVVREQPAPRGQVVHRNGDREHFCSVADLLQYLDIPNPRGRPVKIYVEVMPDAHVLTDMDTTFQPWGEASALTYVTGVQRRGVMGTPVMSYQTAEAAENAAKKFGGRVLSFEQLRKQIHQ